MDPIDAFTKILSAVRILLWITFSMFCAPAAALLHYPGGSTDSCRPSSFAPCQLGSQQVGVPHTQGRQLLLVLPFQLRKSGCSLLLLLCQLRGHLLLAERELGPAREVAGWRWFLVISTTGPSCTVDGCIPPLQDIVCRRGRLYIARGLFSCDLATSRLQCGKSMDGPLHAGWFITPQP